MKHALKIPWIATAFTLAGSLTTHAALAADATDMTEAEVRKVDVPSGKLTLKHGEIKNLDMPAMTMVFVVKDKAQLDKLKAGHKVRFKAAMEGGTLTVTEIEPAR